MSSISLHREGPLAGVILSDTDLDKFGKLDGCGERMSEARLYEQAAMERFYKEAQLVIVPGIELKAVGNDWGCLQGVFSLHPITEITSVKYWDAAGELQTLPESGYYRKQTDHKTTLQWIGTMPAVADRPDAITMTVKAGFGPTLPKVVKHAVVQSIIYYLDKPEEYNKRWSTSFDYVIDMFRRSWV